MAPTLPARARAVVRSGHGSDSVACRSMARVDARADHVGSLLRPRTLLSARAELAAGRLAPPECKPIEDAAVREVDALQEEAGCPVVTDAELRRESFQAELVAATTGVEGAGLDAWLWCEWHSD